MKQDSYKVSVLMPAHNAAKFIKQAIDSVLNQTYSNIELLIADDCSEDNTKEIIDSYQDERIIRFHNSENLGYLKAINKLLKHATGQYIAFQDADDYSDVKKIETQLKTLLNNPEYSVCGTGLTMVTEEGEELFCPIYYQDHSAIMKSILNVEFAYSPNSLLFSREVYEEIGGYNEYFDIGGEDYYWTWLIMEKFKLMALKDAFYYYRLNPDSMTGDLSNRFNSRHNKAILQYLLRERTETNTDSIESGDCSKLDAYIYKIDKAHREDPSLFYRELARKYYYEGKQKRAIKLLIKAIKKAPLKYINFKTFFYYLRTYNS